MPQIFKSRQPIAKCSYRKRFLGLCAREVQLLRKWKKLFRLSLLMTSENSGLRNEEVVDLQRLAFLICFRLGFEPIGFRLRRPIRLNRRIDFFHSEDCWPLFRFRKDDLYRLKVSLRIPESVTLQNGISVSGDEVLLCSLRRFSSAGTLHDLTHLFGRDLSTWSRTFTWFLSHICDTFSDTLLDNLEFWEPMFYDFSESIRNKLENYGLHYPRGEFLVCAFIDDHCFQSCRPGGPDRSGVNSVRAPTLLQRAFYNGWKSQHGLKWQTVDAPCGMTIDMWGPRSLRHSDLNLLEWSNIAGRLLRVQEDAERQHLRVIYGDGIFPWQQCLRSKHKGPNLTALQRLENSSLCKTRVSVEWQYGQVAELFPFTDYKKNIKLRNANSARVYFVATFLRNCHTCLYGNTTSAYFNCTPPTLEQYLNTH